MNNSAKEMYVPKPKVIKSKYSIGVYYFPGWKKGTHDGWSKIMPFPERKPLLGWYREEKPEVADWHIKWAVEHGIEFFAYDWYWCQGKRSLDHAIHEGYFNARYKDYLKFCLLWANHNPDKTASREDLINVTRYWLDNYFHLPQYYTIDGKPVIIIHTIDRLTKDIGAQGVKDAFEQIRSMCRERGLSGLYIAGCCLSDKVHDYTRGIFQVNKEGILQMKEEGYDSATGYNYAGAGATQEELLGNSKRIPYDSAVDGYRQIWEGIAEHIDYIPVTDPGWDSRPWYKEKEALVRTGKHPDKFKRMLEYAREFADHHPIGKEKKKIVLVEAWNEFGEGDFIEPHQEYRFAYLDAIREVFTDAGKKHKDIVPAEVGLGPYD